MGSRAVAIIWAQWRTFRNFLPRTSKIGFFLTTLLSAAWYLSFAVLAVASAMAMADPTQIEFMAKVLPGGLLLAFLYWQLIPLLLVSTGSALEMKKLTPYPIPSSELFTLEVLLRVTTGFEVVLVFLGTGVGLLLNPRIPKWAPLSLVVYAAFNLLVSAGVRDLLSRLLARKAIREVLVFVFVLAAALPQFLILSQPADRLKAWLPSAVPVLSALLLPWSATAALAQGHLTWVGVASLCGWTALAYGFGRWQFERGLRFDVQELEASDRGKQTGLGWTERIFRFPALLFSDPLAVVMEKEMRVLSRSSRFRLVFIMGFSFGLLIWLPVTFGRSSDHTSWMANNYLSLVCVYALLLLSDVLFWNVFGFDRSGAQNYFVAPVSMAMVLRAKNLVAFTFIALDVTLVGLVCALLRFPVSLEKMMEAYAVAFTTALFLIAVGNLSSVYNPKGVDPGKSFRSNAGRQTQAILMFFFPVALIPSALAFAARYAFETDLAFFGTLAFSAAFGAVFHRIATESAVAAIEKRKESMIAALSGGEGPVA